jgi:hypothetical protein
MYLVKYAENVDDQNKHISQVPHNLSYFMVQCESWFSVCNLTPKPPRES